MELFIIPAYHGIITLLIATGLGRDPYGIFATLFIIGQFLLWRSLIKWQIYRFNSKALIRYAAEWVMNIIYVLTAGKDLFNALYGGTFDGIFTLLNTPVSVLYQSCDWLRAFLDKRAIGEHMFSAVVVITMSLIMVSICIYLYIKHRPKEE